ncbi:uncharacterized protein LOC117326121 [Pecten maximus]|uniref:uncharacterized protein LOC117326121 n=1 Tax=Pecten maximus TaxID=6579 RepID=UPI0014588FDA|nr:uncharacterized protein LOC117326121 [Pecten maximus]
MADDSKQVESSKVIVPDYATDEKKKDGFVRVIVAVKNLKTTRQMKGLKFVKKADNADVAVDFQERSFCLTVTGKTKGELKGKQFKLHIKKLPKEISSNTSYFEVDTDRILLFLCKADDSSWYPELDEGLETEEEEAE